MAQTSCWQPLFNNKATFSTIHCSKSVVHVTDPRTRHVNVCREWKTTHKNVVISHFSLFSVRLAYRLATAMRWDFSERTQHSRRWTAWIEKWRIVLCVCFFFCPLHGKLTSHTTWLDIVVIKQWLIPPQAFVVIPMYNERIFIQASLRQVNLSSLHSLLPFYRMYAGLNSLEFLMFTLALHSRSNLICCVSFILLRISFPLLVFCLTQGFWCCVPFLEELRHCYSMTSGGSMRYSVWNFLSPQLLILQNKADQLSALGHLNNFRNNVYHSGQQMHNIY